MLALVPKLHIYFLALSGSLCITTKYLQLVLQFAMFTQLVVR